MSSSEWGSKEWNEAHFPSDQLDKDGEIWGFRWRGMENGEEVIFKKEPQTSAWERFVAGFYRILPIRGFL